jgi:hypothetical protein
VPTVIKTGSRELNRDRPARCFEEQGFDVVGVGRRALQLSILEAIEFCERYSCLGRSTHFATDSEHASLQSYGCSETSTPSGLTLRTI